MSEIKTGGPAFPLHPDMAAILGCINSQSDCGMTLRDYFAAKAMEGFLASPDCGWDRLEVASASYAMADAMLKAREVGHE